MSDLPLLPDDFESVLEDYPIKLEHFEGPLDLLLHLIRKNEVDIYDIPILPITKQYLEYLDLMQEFDLDAAGEFLVMAATLIHIKARMLVPRLEQETEEEADTEDPRDVLVQRLIEHQTYKAAAELLHDRETVRSAQWGRPDERIIDIAGAPFEREFEADLFGLLQAFEAVLKRARERLGVEVPGEAVSIETRTRQLMERLSETEACGFDDLFDGTAPEFIEAKLEERTQRHKKQGGQRYVVEPNVKEGKGGLRDLQTLIWVAKYLHRVVRARELRDVGMFTDEEYANFAEANNFLWAVRCHLHLIAGRAMDQLTFDLQLEVAERMGYVDKGGRQAVEHFMQDYFLHATQVGELTRIFLTGLENEHLKKEPMLVGLFKRRKKVKPGYKIENGRLTFEDEAAFLSDKLNLLRIFEEGLRTGVLIHPDAMRVVTAHLDLIDDDMRDDREASRIFLDLLLKHGNPERALRRMNELGVLSAFVPEFEPIVAMMQFNMYHSYTVDEHTIQVISALAEIERGERLEELPYASRILKEGVNRKVLYVALFCHDIGKGREEDHSILGARIARKVATRLGLTKPEVETVEWLGRYHLLMSDVAQKRDLSDPRTIRGFAKAVSNKKRLDLLLVLTACDIRGVGPGTWNNWKAALLRDLYRQTAQALDEGIEALNTTARTNEAKKALREALADWERKDLRVETGRHYDTYWQGLGNAEHVVFANLLNGLGADEIRIGLTQDHDRDATRAAFVLADHPGIFSRLAGALALVGANVVDARTYTTKDGWATAVFWVQDHDGHPFEDIKLKRLEDMIHKTLSGKVIARDAMKSRDKMKKREKAFTVPTNITFDNDGSDIYTMIEVDTRDRPGLLYDLTRTLADNHVYIASAVIATYGEQVVDTFYVKDMFGLKYYTESKQKTLEKRLRAAIIDGVARAQD